MKVKKALKKYLGKDILKEVDYIYDGDAPDNKRHINTILDNKAGEINFVLKYGETDSPAFRCSCFPGLSEPFLVYEDGKFFIWWNA